MSAAVFVVLALLVVGSAVGVILKRNPIHAALFLVTNLASVAGLYLTLGAEFLAAAQVIVYAGAIAVLFVFAIMVLIPGKEETGPDPLRRQRVMAAPLVGVFLVLVMLVLRSAVALGGSVSGGAPPGSVAALGQLLFTDYLFPFEVTSLLLLVAIVGVMALTKRKVGSE
jgi:NADH-quinone oxidoreductase subunit J